jgi:NAD(P)-dependent dehydrogenase (short-subunit alcohol dehydrogenase family)
MIPIRLDGKVIIVTGAGRGLGRAYALALAERGAYVIVNDLGTSVEGKGSAAHVALEVVETIRAQGGRASANTADVSRTDEAQALVQQALDEYGALDVVVNNAGIGHELPFAQTTLQVFEHHWRVHVGGHVNVSQAAWPIMVKQKHGKIVLTSSGAGLFGVRNLAAYSSAKGAIHGLMRAMAIEGAEHGILVNCIAPGGFTRMQEAALTDPAGLAMMRAAMPPELVAPAIIWLASDRCQVTGQHFSAWAGRFARIAIGSGRGLVDRQLTAEQIADNLDVVRSTSGYFEPDEGMTDVSHWLREAGVLPGG